MPTLFFSLPYCPKEENNKNIFKKYIYFTVSEAKIEDGVFLSSLSYEQNYITLRNTFSLNT